MEKKEKSHYLKKMVQPGDVQGAFADITKAKDLLGYTPPTDLKSRLIQFYKWLMTDQKEIKMVDNTTADNFNYRNLPHIKQIHHEQASFLRLYI